MSEDNKKKVTLKGTEEVSKVPNKKKYFSFDMGFLVCAKNLDFIR